MKALVAALGLAVYAATPAAAQGSTYEGGCGFSAVPDQTPASIGERGHWTGALYFDVVLRSADGTPAAAEVSCRLWSTSGSTATLGPVHVDGAGVAAERVTYDAWHTDLVGVCTVVDWADGTPDVDDCPDSTAICTGYCFVMEQTEAARNAAEAEVCAELGGDGYVAGQWVLDCPPYGGG